MEPGKLASAGHPLPVRPRLATARATPLLLMLVLLAAGCDREAGGSGRQPEDGRTAAGDAASDSAHAMPGAGSDASAAGIPGEPAVQVLRDTGFRPVAFQDSATLWGILRGRLARLELPAGRAEPAAHNAWSLAAAPGVVSWRNETGTWGERAGDSPRRLAPTELMPGYEGPPDVLWSPDGRRAILTWSGEWDGHHELLRENGERSTLATFEEGYMLDFPALWLDHERVLFTIVANAPRGGEPAYRESGWRGDLAVLDLAADDGAGEFRRVTDTPDTTWLRPAGLLGGQVLVREDGPRGPVRFWLYDPEAWSRQPFDLPPSRAFAAGDAVLTFEPVDAGGDAWEVRLHAGGRTTRLGRAAEPDLAPAMTRDGRQIALRVVRDGRAELLWIHR